MFDNFTSPLSNVWGWVKAKPKKGTCCLRFGSSSSLVCSSSTLRPPHRSQGSHVVCGVDLCHSSLPPALGRGGRFWLSDLDNGGRCAVSEGYWGALTIGQLATGRLTAGLL